MWLSWLGIVVSQSKKVTGSTSCQGTCLGCGFSPWLGHIAEADQCYSLTLMFPSLSLPHLPSHPLLKEREGGKEEGKKERKESEKKEKKRKEGRKEQNISISSSREVEWQYLTRSHPPPTSVAQGIRHRPAKVTGLVPGQGTCLGCRPGPCLGACERPPTHQCFSPYLSFSLEIKSLKKKSHPLFFKWITVRYIITVVFRFHWIYLKDWYK